MRGMKECPLQSHLLKFVAHSAALAPDRDPGGAVPASGRKGSARGRVKVGG